MLPALSLDEEVSQSLFLYMYASCTITEENKNSYLESGTFAVNSVT